MGKNHDSLVSPPSLPRELVEAVTAFANRDATCVGDYLDAQIREIQGQIGADYPCPRWQDVCSHAFVLELAAALRLREWERLKLVRSDMGLPDSETAIAEVISHLADGTLAPALSPKVLSTFVNHFAWSGLTRLGIDVLILASEEEELAARIAAVLWQHRHLAFAPEIENG